MDKPIIVLDTITTAQGGKRLLEHRVASLNKDPDFTNYLSCPEDAYFTGAFEEKGLPFIPFPMSRRLNPIRAAGEIFRFIRLLKKMNPDVVHAHTSKAGAVSRIGCALFNFGRRKKVYVCYQVHSFYFNSLSGLKRSLFLFLERFLAGLSDALLFQNDHELEQAKQYDMGRKALLINIGNGIKLNEFPFPRGPRRFVPWCVQSAADSYELKRQFIIICVARIEPKKNHKMLIDTVKIVSEKLVQRYGPEAGKNCLKVYCIGEIGEDWIPDYSAREQMEKIIEFTGVKNRDEVAEYLRKGDLSVLTSIAEGKPRALMESMSTGIPCIATDVCGTQDVVDDKKTGFLIPLGNTAAFADAILILMEDPDLYEAFSKASYEKANREFDEDRVIERLKDIYREKPKKQSRRLS
ncbi:glycosyltransferase [Treponema sp. OttesenSCG-928-L16]|nr:glycosyltransferase [Treponema sp. OttesenSCG-928-L16]